MPIITSSLACVSLTILYLLNCVPVKSHDDPFQQLDQIPVILQVHQASGYGRNARDSQGKTGHASAEQMHFTGIRSPQGVPQTARVCSGLLRCL